MNLIETYKGLNISDFELSKGIVDKETGEHIGYSYMINTRVNDNSHTCVPLSLATVKETGLYKQDYLEYNSVALVNPIYCFYWEERNMYFPISCDYSMVNDSYIELDYNYIVLGNKRFSYSSGIALDQDLAIERAIQNYEFTVAQTDATETE